MNLKSIFLTLSIKMQIFIIISALNTFCFIVIISFCGTFVYEMLKDEYKQKKLYFYDKYEEYVESCFYFQNYYLLQYEEIIKKFQKQIWKHHNSFDKFLIKSNFKLPNDFITYIGNEPTNLINLTEKKSNFEDIYIMNDFCFLNNTSFCLEMYKKFLLHQVLFMPMEFYHIMNDFFRMPMHEVPLMTSPLYIYFNLNSILSFNPSRIINHIKQIFPNISDFDPLDYNKSIIYQYNKSFTDINNIYEFIKENNSSIFLHMFNNIINEILHSEEYSKIIQGDINSYYEFTKKTTGYFSRINYSSSLFYIICNNDDLFQVYVESTIVENYLYFMNSKLLNFVNINFIPLFNYNNTLISSELCILFLLKQYNYFIDSNKLDKLYEKIKRGKTKIEECFIDPNILNKQLEIKDILNLNLSTFYLIPDININKGIINLKNFPYYLMKYTYPNYNALKEFKSDYLFIDQVNYYLFAPFIDPIKFSNLFLQISENCFYLLILIIAYIWYFCFIINMIIFLIVIKQLVEPFKNLKIAVESNSISDENVFKYKYDKIINELFLSCKELLTGKIEVDYNGYLMENFNILSILKEKDIDNNKYKKNLIINNDIINKLIVEQNNMLDFSKNIKINENINESPRNEIKQIKNESLNLISFNSNPIFNHDNIENKNKKNLIKDNLNLDDINEIKYSISFHKNKEEIEREDRKPYKKLYKITEYISYLQNKKEQNYFYVNNNTISNEKNATISRNMKKSLKINLKWKKNIKNNDNEEIAVNMLGHKNISYLWYMEAKLKKNKSLNFTIGNNYEGLFVDNNMHYQD